MIKKDPILSWLWFGWLGLLLTSFVAGWTSDLWWHQARLDLRMVSCLLLALAAWHAWFYNSSVGFSKSLFWIAVGMTLGFYGDSHVGSRLWWPPFPHAILGGVTLFGLGHMAYIAACLRLRSSGQVFPPVRKIWGQVLLWQIVGLVGWAAIALSSQTEQQLRWPTLLYTLLVAATPGVSNAVGRHWAPWRWVAWGAVLFFVSDLLLAWQLFHQPFFMVDELTWVCYGVGQMLIVYGAQWAEQSARTDSVERF